MSNVRLASFKTTRRLCVVFASLEPFHLWKAKRLAPVVRLAHMLMSVSPPLVWIVKLDDIKMQRDKVLAKTVPMGLTQVRTPPSMLVPNALQESTSLRPVAQVARRVKQALSRLLLVKTVATSARKASMLLNRASPLVITAKLASSKFWVANRFVTTVYTADSRRKPVMRHV